MFYSDYSFSSIEDGCMLSPDYDNYSEEDLYDYYVNREENCELIDTFEVCELPF